MPNSQTERDYDDQGALKRPGRLDFNTLNNKDNVGDGYPGVQKCLRNWVQEYLHDGVIEQDVDMNSKNITNVTNVDGVDISAIALDNMPTAPTGDIPVNSQQITGLADGVDAQDAQAFGQRYTDTETESVITAEIVNGQSIDNAIDDLILTHKNIATAHHTATVAGDLNLNDLLEKDHASLANKNAEVNIKHLTDAEQSALHATYTDVEARGAIGDIFDGSGIVQSDIDFDDNGTTDLDNINDNIYFCSTSAEIQAAIDAIGAGAGTIILESGTITVDTAIDIDNTGSVVIQGQGESTILDASVNCFNITSITSCVLRNFRIDGANLGAGVYAIIVGENKVTIDNVYTNLPATAKGINITGDFNTVENCSFSGGLSITCSGDSNSINGNSITASLINGSLINISGSYNDINDNRLYSSNGGFAGGVGGAYPIYGINI